MFRKIQGCGADVLGSIAISVLTLAISTSPSCAYQIPNTAICFCRAKRPWWSLLQWPLSIPLPSDFLRSCMMPTNSNIFARSFDQRHQNKILLRAIAWHSVSSLFFRQSPLPTATFCLWPTWCQLPGKELKCWAPCCISSSCSPVLLPVSNFITVFSVFCSFFMHLVLAVKCGLFSMFNIKSYIWKWFINEIRGWRPVEIGLQGPIILWKMPAMVGFASQRLSIIDSLIQILCSDCKQWPVSQLYTYTGAANSSLDRHTHLCSFVLVPSSFALTVFILFYFMQDRLHLSPSKLSMLSTTIGSHHH